MTVSKSPAADSPDSTLCVFFSADQLQSVKVPTDTLYEVDAGHRTEEMAKD